MPRPRLAGFTASRSRPSSMIAPPLGSTKPAIICSVVVLPQPEGPSSDTNSPFSTSSDRPSTAACVPKCLVSLSRVRKAMLADPLDRLAMQAEEGVLRLVHRQYVVLRSPGEQPA